MTRRRPLVALALGLGTVLATLGALGVPGGAQIRGACVVTVNGRDASRADSPDRAFEFGEGDVIEVVGTSTAPVRSYDITLEYGPIRFPAKSGTPSGDDTRWSGEVQVDDYTPFGVGLYKVEGSSTGAAPCSGTAYLRITGPFPLFTVAGAVATLLAVGGIAGMVSALRPTGRPGRGHRVRGPIFGAVAGIGVAVLLQQLAVLPMSTALLLGAPAVGALAGLALGWPRGGAPGPPAPEPTAATVGDTPA